MKAARAKRRWVKWCRYVAKTGTSANFRSCWKSGFHSGQAKAFTDVMYAKRYAPIGVREVWYPKWGIR